MLVSWNGNAGAGRIVLLRRLQSLERLCKLPSDTVVLPGHNYVRFSGSQVLNIPQVLNIYIVLSITLVILVGPCVTTPGFVGGGGGGGGARLSSSYCFCLSCLPGMCTMLLSHTSCLPFRVGWLEDSGFADVASGHMNEDGLQSCARYCSRFG